MTAYHDYETAINILGNAKAALEDAGSDNSDVLAEVWNWLSDKSAELAKERDGEPLNQMLAEQARDEREMRDWYQRSIA